MIDMTAIPMIETVITGKHEITDIFLKEVLIHGHTLDTCSM